MMNNEIKSVLNLKKIVFDRILFERLGFSSEEELKLKIETNVSQKKDTELYRVTLVLFGEKEGEYKFEVSITGFFDFDTDEELTQEFKSSLINQNTVAILMPYLRSEISLLTAQPGVDCVVLPPFNITELVKQED